MLQPARCAALYVSAFVEKLLFQLLPSVRYAELATEPAGLLNRTLQDPGI